MDAGLMVASTIRTELWEQRAANLGTLVAVSSSGLSFFAQRMLGYLLPLTFH